MKYSDYKYEFFLNQIETKSTFINPFGANQGYVKLGQCQGHTVVLVMLTRPSATVQLTL